VAGRGEPPFSAELPSQMFKRYSLTSLSPYSIDGNKDGPRWQLVLNVCPSFWADVKLLEGLGSAGDGSGRLGGAITNGGELTHPGFCAGDGSSGGRAACHLSTETFAQYCVCLHRHKTTSEMTRVQRNHNT